MEYADAQIMALKTAFAAIALFSLLALWYVDSLLERADGEAQTLYLRKPNHFWRIDP